MQVSHFRPGSQSVSHKLRFFPFADLHETRPSVHRYGGVERESDVNTTIKSHTRSIRHNGRGLASEVVISPLPIRDADRDGKIVRSRACQQKAVGASCDRLKKAMYRAAGNWTCNAICLAGRDRTEIRRPVSLFARLNNWRPKK